MTEWCAFHSAFSFLRNTLTVQILLRHLHLGYHRLGLRHIPQKAVALVIQLHIDPRLGAEAGQTGVADGQPDGLPIDGALVPDLFPIQQQPAGAGICGFFLDYPLFRA